MHALCRKIGYVYPKTEKQKEKNRKESGMGRTELREHIFKLLFCREFNNPQDMQEQLELYFGKMEGISDSDREYIETKYRAAAEKLDELDEQINSHATRWKTSRMNKVDLTILRLAVYEIKWDEEVPTSVAINEAVELAKKFSAEEAGAFVNGVLAKFVE